MRMTRPSRTTWTVVGGVLVASAFCVLFKAVLSLGERDVGAALILSSVGLSLNTAGAEMLAPTWGD
jgi:hypothetical protein